MVLKTRSEQAFEQKLKQIMADFNHNGEKFEVLCKCKNMNDANQKAKAAGLGTNFFKNGCCTKVEKQGTVNLVNLVETDLAVCVDGRDIVSLDACILERLMR